MIYLFDDDWLEVDTIISIERCANDPSHNMKTIINHSGLQSFSRHPINEVARAVQLLKHNCCPWCKYAYASYWTVKHADCDWDVDKNVFPEKQK